MIVKGTVTRIGGGIIDTGSGMARIEALELTGHAEIRGIKGSSYIIDHLRDAIGGEVTIGMVGKTLVAVKKGGRTYRDTGIRTSINAHLLFWLLSILFIFVGAPVIVFIFSKMKMSKVAEMVSNS